METSSLEETHSNHLIPLQFRIREASITDCSYWLLVVSPKSLNAKNKLKQEISIDIIQYVLLLFWIINVFQNGEELQMHFPIYV